MAPEESNLELKYACLNKNLMERLIRELLLVHFYRVEVYTCKKGEKDEYIKMYKGSPGNLVQFENLLSNSSNTNEVFSNLLVSLQVITCHQQKVNYYKCICTYVLIYIILKSVFLFIENSYMLNGFR